MNLRSNRIIKQETRDKNTFQINQTYYQKDSSNRRSTSRKMSRLTNVILVGATGSIGSVVLEAFQKDATFNLTVLQRASSKSRLPDHLKIITIADSYPVEELVGAFKGQDAVINCMTTLSVTDQFRMIDAAIAAGVQRYVPSEYGLDNMRADAQALNPVFANKGKVQAYLRAKADEGMIEWMGISCGMWLKWAMAHNFLGMHVQEQRFVFWDEGAGYFSCTTEENTAAGLLQALKVPDETKNMNVFLSDFAITQTQLLEAIERIQGVKYKTEAVNSEKFIEEKQAAVKAGDDWAALALIETAFVTGRFGGHLEKEGTILNEKLGLPKRTVDEVVTNALRAAGVL
ncbi:NmrA-like family protein [Nemania sp. FL0031]|nr:NmrA-like family protein [Nemania sp. FL0031]